MASLSCSGELTVRSWRRDAVSTKSGSKARSCESTRQTSTQLQSRKVAGDHGDMMLQYGDHDGLQQLPYSSQRSDHVRTAEKHTRGCKP